MSLTDQIRSKSEVSSPSVISGGGEQRLSIKDTDFLLKVLMKSSFIGNEIEQAYTVISKIAEMHRRNLEN